ncbi:MAG TPA: cation:proton antiporter [bacterium]|nr:cation:proton antiporter [bacterium]
MAIWEILLEMLILLGAAFLLGAVAERFRQNAIIGYLAAGAIVGPHALNVITSAKEVGYIAELGVSLLLFSIGLEFSFSRLKRLGSAALGGGAVQVGLTILVVTALSIALGLHGKEALAMGAVVALSSTACVLRVLTDRAEMDSMYGRYALGILLFQDIAVVPLILLITMLGQGGEAEEAFEFLGRTVIAVIGLGVGFYLVFYLITPRILLRSELKRNQELSVLLAVLIGVGATWMAHEVGLSPALGAFLAGMLLAESPFAMQVRAGASGLKAIFIVLFFSSAGMYANPSWVASNALLVIAGIIAIAIGKSIITTLSLIIFRAVPVHSAAAGIALGQIGEFSFLLATAAAGMGIFSGDLLSLILSVTVGTLFLSSYQVSWAMPLAELILRLFKKTGSSDSDSDDAQDHNPVLVIGYGPAGRRTAEELISRSYNVSVIDLNTDNMKKAGEKGIHVHIGDATHTEILEHTGVSKMRAVVVTIPDTNTARRITERIKILAPNVPLIVRARYNLHIPEIKKAGASVIVDEEWEVGYSLADKACKAINCSLS